jgi:hypothetical protein
MEKHRFKKTTVLIGINNLSTVQQWAYSNHLQLMYNLGKISRDYNIDFGICNPLRMSIDSMRNFSGQVVIGKGKAKKFDYLWFIDDDVLVPGDAFLRLWKLGKDISAGVTYIRGYPYHPMLFDFSNKENHYIDNYRERADKQGYLKCDAVGFSCCLISGRFLRKYAKLKDPTTPLFLTGTNFTEDVWFCQKAKEAIPKISIYADINVQTGHILGPEVIEHGNLKQRKKFDESLNPSLGEKNVKKAGLPNSNSRVS